MSRYRVILAVPAVVAYTVDLLAEDQAGAMANALDAVAALAPGQALPLVSVEPAMARIEGCSRLDDAPQAHPMSPATLRPYRVFLYADAALARRASEFESSATLAAAGVEVRELAEQQQAVALAARLLEGADMHHTARVVSPEGRMVYQAVNPYGAIALVAYDSATDADACNDAWRLVEGWLPDVKTARRRALAVLEQGFVKTVGVAVREPAAVANKGGLQVRLVLRDV